MEKKDSYLDELKKNYLKVQKKHNLPSFDELNREFHIEKISEESDYLIREIRKFIAEKFSNYLRFIETLLNPVSPPIFIYSVIKSFGEKERMNLNEIYKKLAKNEVFLIELDLNFDEEKEAQFIKESYKIWKDIKKDLLKIIEVIKKNWDSKSEVNGKNYFG